MLLVMANNLLSDNVRILKAEASKTAYQGVAIAITSIIIATLLTSYYQNHEISTGGIIEAQKSNFALWILDGIPFVFALWGQYSSSLIAYQASAMIFDQTHELRSRANELERKATYTATHDEITGLPNRSLFYDRVEQGILFANKKHGLVSILLIEISNIKEVYDTLGRTSSDQIIKQVSSRLQGIVLGADSIARIDSNLFAILIDDSTGNHETEILARKIQNVLEPPFIVERLSFAAHTNIGIVHFPEHGEDVDTLVQKAGVALYIASKNKDGFAVYDPSYDKHSPRRLTLMSELRHAIDRNQLELHYQPKISLENNQIYGAESLVRWNHPKHGFISPDEFIPMAERTRMIKPLTLWVLKSAFQQCAKWRQQGYDFIISVNLSTKDLHDPELPDVISGIAVSTNVNPEWIILEITESSIISQPELTLEILHRLHNMGYKLSIDDYGTGYSSLSYLKKMPLTELKIDRSFVQDMLNSDNDDVIVRATINLAHNLGLQVTAEGIETAEVMEKLKSYQCDIIQGFYISKPLPVSKFDEWIKTTDLPARQLS